MHALVYHGPGQRAWESVPDPVIQDPTDAIVRIDVIVMPIGEDRIAAEASVFRSVQ